MCSRLWSFASSSHDAQRTPGLCQPFPIICFAWSRILSLALLRCLLWSWEKGAKGKISASVLSLCCPSPNLTHAPGEPPSKPGQRQSDGDSISCHQRFGPCTENCPHPQGNLVRSSHQTMQLQELQRQCRKLTWAGLDLTGPPCCRTPFLFKE